MDRNPRGVPLDLKPWALKVTGSTHTRSPSSVGRAVDSWQFGTIVRFCFWSPSYGADKKPRSHSTWIDKATELNGRQAQLVERLTRGSLGREFDSASGHRHTELI